MDRSRCTQPPKHDPFLTNVTLYKVNEWRLSVWSTTFEGQWMESFCDGKICTFDLIWDLDDLGALPHLLRVHTAIYRAIYWYEEGSFVLTFFSSWSSFVALSFMLKKLDCTALQVQRSPPLYTNRQYLGQSACWRAVLEIRSLEPTLPRLRVNFCSISSLAVPTIFLVPCSAIRLLQRDKNLGYCLLIVSTKDWVDHGPRV